MRLRLRDRGRLLRGSWPLLKGDQVSISLFLRRNILYRPVLGGPRAFVYVCVVAVRYVVGCRLRFLYSAVVLSSSFSKCSNSFLYVGESLQSKFVEGNQHIIARFSRFQVRIPLNQKQTDTEVVWDIQMHG